ncbi:hypothetical protein Clacol_006340 [Clathrus columnatus]|uniref:alpha-1,3-glucan synthase n=1 Tax=Clathrus columnatus TaxID=1419009 RepID=A0AAV5AHD8_9AGAM|nr:hypothetical protein Clacol_006340 [Clathrus columnatus]
MRPPWLILGLSIAILYPSLVLAIAFRDDLVDYNLNTNKNATSVLEYQTIRRSSYTPSPTNWRALPFYIALLDKYADGDPTNNDFFNTTFENDWRETGLRYGGDLKGLRTRLDYLQGMGMKGIFIAGTGFLNLPWQADSYSVIDFSLMDPHWGTISEWQTLIDDIHARNMYIIMDFTVSTMADFIGFKGHLNESTPFSTNQYQTEWKLPEYAPWGFETYPDFMIDNVWNSSCQLPTFWNDDGTEIDSATIPFSGCYTSEFDQFGDMEAFGVHPDWQRQLAKFASVQDRLREWDPNVMAKIQVYACLTIEALDIDGIRVDKATQITLDSVAKWATATKACAAKFGKDNFFIAGEVTGGDTFGSLYLNSDLESSGRGRTPTQRPPGFLQAANLTKTQDQYFLRDAPDNGLDGVAFHYSIYRALTRVLGMDGNLEDAFDISTNFVTAWNEMMVNNDFLNANTGELDPRHMYGVSNFDVYRWPSLVNGTQRAVLGMLITTLVMPGIPLTYYGEEQNFYLYDNGASNYLFGRQAMSSSLAWQRHGCYKLGSDQYFNMPLEKALLGCNDDWNSLDHFDPTSATRRLIGHFNYLRSTYPALQDGFDLVQRGNWTHFEQLPGSNETQTELGWWTISRAALSEVQIFQGDHTDQVWIVYTNENASHSYSFDCNGPLWVSTPYVSGTTIKNLLYPYETYQLQDSLDPFSGNTGPPWTGCLPQLSLQPYDFKVFVPVDMWVPPLPRMTKFIPGHDARIQVTSTSSNSNNVPISFEFNMAMNCDSITNNLKFNVSSSMIGGPPIFNPTSVVCGPVANPDSSIIIGADLSQWAWSVTLTNVPDGIIELTLTNVTNEDGSASTGAVDHLLIRKGFAENVMVFPNADYDNEAFTSSGSDFLFTHKAFGADSFRYTADYGQTWSQWQNWENVTMIPGGVFSSDAIFWEGEHIIVQYWSSLTMSSTQVVHADRSSKFQRRVPQFLVRGPFNEWGFDQGIPSQMELVGDGQWQLEIMSVWPTYMQLNVFGFDNYFYGDTDGDGVLDRLPPNSDAPNYVNLSAPPHPHLAWALIIDDTTMTWSAQPRGFSVIGAIMYALLLVIPLLTGACAVLVFRWTFYGIRYNKWGIKPKESRNYFTLINHSKKSQKLSDVPVNEKMFGLVYNKLKYEPIGWPEVSKKRRKVLIATLEYEIFDWKLKVKIGGLGVMSSLMGKVMNDVDLVWVVPKVKDLEYPVGDPAKPIEVVLFGDKYLIEVETHTLDNITYVLLDSPVFRAQTKSDPYPARMDDLSSAIFYSTWNQAIATTIRRFSDIDIYHVNDYHGGLAPIYLLPKVIPVCLSLHNAEFQGLWPLRTKEELKEVCSAFNVSKEYCEKYIQFGNTFNLLHAAASYISVHQKSVGVAGVSDKYGKRSWARYPALWTLKHVDSLPNPDPTDIEVLDENPIDLAGIKIDEAAEALRPELKRQAQEWAGIKQDPKSDLFVFVGRWSKQKGVDLIADVMPSLLAKRASIQLIAVGPVIDLYGRFAAEKLARLMELYPDRVYSKPEFTSLPPYIFSGADFALIPSRDEPFGLVAVEFGRKGALGVGSRLGGLGLMPGWWFPVESTSIGHMLSQLTKTIKMALNSTEEERAILRARSAVQRFPVVEWRQRMEDLHRRSITISRNSSNENAWRPSDGRMQNSSLPELEVEDWEPDDPDQYERHPLSMDLTMPPLSPASPFPTMPGRASQITLTLPNNGRRESFSTEISDDESQIPSRDGTERQANYNGFLSRVNRQFAKDQRHVADPFLSNAPNRSFGYHSRASSVESIASIVDEKTDSPLNKAIATFTDADGEVIQEFIRGLQNLSPENSKGELSIERFLTKSEEKFFGKLRRERLSSAASFRSSIQDLGSGRSAEESSPDISSMEQQIDFEASGDVEPDSVDQFSEQLKDGVVLSKLQIALQRRIGGWPLYAVILALGQMLGATSFQITLLSGQNWQDNLQLYVLGAVFLVASAIWYTLFRLKPSVYVLSLPWIFYGLAFFFIGLPTLSTAFNGSRKIITDLATWSYAVASAASFLYFGLNFGEEAGAATDVWALRACIVQGSQQIWVTALWYWGNQLNGATPNSSPPTWVVLILWPLAAACFIFFWLILKGLPALWTQLVLLVELPNTEMGNFVTYCGILRLHLGRYACDSYIFKQDAHMDFTCVRSWPRGSPLVSANKRVRQMLWGTSSLALYIPWAGKAGPYLGTSLWLWLGVLDAIQGVGLGMILLQTLSRLHVCATLAFAQVIGAICVMIARATAPNRLGPTSVFPNAGTWDFTSKYTL